MKTITDEMLGEVAGGYMSVSQWIDYLSTQVMPVLNGLMTGASENDRTLLGTIYGTLQGTAIPGAGVVDTVTNLWTTYNTVYRPSLQSSKIQVTLDQTLYGAKQYVDSHR